MALYLPTVKCRTIRQLLAPYDLRDLRPLRPFLSLLTKSLFNPPVTLRIPFGYDLGSTKGVSSNALILRSRTQTSVINHSHRS